MLPAGAPNGLGDGLPPAEEKAGDTPAVDPNGLAAVKEEKDVRKDITSHSIINDLSFIRIHCKNNIELLQ